MNRYSRDPTRLLNHQPLLAVARARSVDRSTLETELDVSRATVYRQTSALVDEGLLKRTNRGYRTTGAGTAVLDAAERFERSLAAADRLKPLLEHLSPSVLTENLHLFADATVMAVDPESPYAIEQRLESVISDVDERIYGAATSFGSPVTLARTVDCVEGGVDFEWALPQAVLERLECQHGELHETVRAHDNASVYVTEDVVDLSLYDDTLVLTGFDTDRGTLAAVAMTDSSAAVDWACDVFETHRERGERLS
ncbi:MULTISPECIES: winged helix-turn-helix domain-containing protein [unclassified Haloferax]|uniref:Uncharacterized protein n=1 Tax=Haloferax sp. Atlit-48N TaxID=2077198 RepID=A0ACD5I1E9_9EURY|nr:MULTISPECIES: hypothetical protein [unclassified Haloferax]